MILKWKKPNVGSALGDMKRTYSVEVKPFPQQFCLSTEIGNCTLVFSAKFNFSSRVRHWIVLKSLCQESLNMAKLALSRACSLQGLRVLDFDSKCVCAHPDVLCYYARLQQRKPKPDLFNLQNEDKENIYPC